MANKNEIVISIDEYKELLLKNKHNNKDTAPVFCLSSLPL